MLRATLAYREGDLSAAEALGAQAVELESEPDSPWRAVALATLGAARHFRGAPSDEVVRAARGGRRDRALGRQQHGGAARAGHARRGRPSPPAISTARRGGSAAADALRAQQSLEEYWMGSLATAVAGQLAADAGELEQARERLERAVVLALRGAARPEHIYALAALAPVQSTLGDADAAAATLRTRAARAARARRARACSRTCSTTSIAACAARPPRAVRAEVEELSAREMSVLRLLGSELSIAEIGEELFISRNTVKTHVRGIYRKLDADTRAVAVARAQGAAPALTAHGAARERPVDGRAHQRPERST